MDVVVAPNAEEASHAVAVRLSRWLRDAVAKRGAATLALSGGSTPARMVRELTADGDVPWWKVDVWQVDERVAPNGDPARNAALLAPFTAAGARTHPMPVTAKDLRAAARRYAAALPEQFDVVHLGVGDDGHTASWPPGDPVIDAAGPVALCGLFNGFVRMTLTPAPVNAARRRLVEVSGSSKAEPVGRWLGGDRDLPIARVRRTGTLVVLDADAAAALAR